MKTEQPIKMKLTQGQDAMPYSKLEIMEEPYFDICTEECFKERLCYERKRTERSGKPFLLVVLKLGKILKVMSSGETLKDMLSLLFISARVTDLCGWYRHFSEIGIIFTDIDEHGTRQAMNAISMKIRQVLLNNLPLSLVNKFEITYHFFPEKYNVQAAVQSIDTSLYPDIANHRSCTGVSRLAKRSIDLFGSALAMLIFSPLILVVSLLIKITSKGPVLFKQERIGRFGEKFVFLKFRSMHINCDDSIHREYIKKLIAGEINTEKGNNPAGGSRVFKLQNDPRVTSIGAFLRKTSLDEIPQFLNVLRGEMSLVGPRPSIPYEFEKYDIWHRHRLLQVKPGITGLWQVKGRSSTSFDEMVRLDLRYLRDWSVWLDIKLLLMTPWAVLKGKGAY